LNRFLLFWSFFIKLSSRLLPYALFSGVMVFVIEEVIPESEKTGYHEIASISGFSDL